MGQGDKAGEVAVEERGEPGGQAVEEREEAPKKKGEACGKVGRDSRSVGSSCWEQKEVAEEVQGSWEPGVFPKGK